MKAYLLNSILLTEISNLKIGQEIKIKAGKNITSATILAITKNSIRIQLSSSLIIIIYAMHIALIRDYI
ncbi:hypothetical protein [Candidatus Fukatsuia anoeciicola]|uniref:hypothetical protein n=1 Tax=Candidatus Fukatsuia anoeciicola TaxID=2994492 RepID=UPI0034641F71